ncbi:MAG TPA: DUF5615 family PIN-like protein [Terriglobales bacterium]|nr:DUF5615 family PIN-like protein [Terriglobales bacterium]
MKLKLDENLGKRGRELLVHAGHDVATVQSESLQTAEDLEVIELCRREQRALVSLDLDFANPFALFPATIAASPSSGCRENQLMTTFWTLCEHWRQVSRKKLCRESFGLWSQVGFESFSKNKSTEKIYKQPEFI